MIKLNVKDYCHDCPEFEPEVEKETYRSSDPFSFNQSECVKTNTTVTCVHTYRCMSMVNALTRIVTTNKISEDKG